MRGGRRGDTRGTRLSGCEERAGLVEDLGVEG